VSTPIGQVLTYALIPVAATTIGGIVATIRAPGRRVGSAIEHFAGGVILAAAVVELLPDAMHGHAPGAIVVGFALAVALTLTVKALTGRIAPEGDDDDDGDTDTDDDAEHTTGPWSLIVVAGLDTLIDGVLLGIGFVAGVKQGLLLTLALTIETLSLGLSVAVALRPAGVSRGRIIATTVALSVLFGVGAVAGAVLLGGLSGVALTTLFAFGAAVLIYLVTEELLVEAHEVPETIAATPLFFVGFVLLVVIDMSV
jgi:ZIP family zinc transporter